MSIIVQKFGGTSVANLEKIKRVADIIALEAKEGKNLAVVVSAMAGVTDQLVGYAKEITTLDSQDKYAEYDSILATGEQVTAGLLALALKEKGLKARSYLAWQLPINTDDNYANAKIEEIVTEQITEGFRNNEIAIVAGFQGVNSEARVTTLGRGGSDTSAVALASALKAERCDIYTDVDGVYTTDPRIVANARKLDKVSYEEMLELASLGAKVLHVRAVNIAMKYKIPLRVLSSFSDNAGTMVSGEDKDMEDKVVTGIAYTSNDARITLKRVPDKPGTSAAIFGPLADSGINVDMILQNIAETKDEADMTFTVPISDVDHALKILENAKDKINYKDITIDKNIAKISIVGVGMKTHAGVAKTMFCTLAEKGINIMAIATSEIKVSVIIANDYKELAIRALHQAFELDKEIKHAKAVNG